MAIPSPSPEQQLDAIRETLRLVGNLSNALATQLRRAARLAGELPSPPSTSVYSALVDDAERIKPHYEQFCEALGQPLAQLEAQADALQAAQDRAQQTVRQARADRDEMAERLRQAEAARDDAVRTSEKLKAVRHELQQRVEELARRKAEAEEQAARAGRAWADSEAARQAERQAAGGAL